MTIAYVEPFQRAWRRMTLLLFVQSAARNWFVIGFAAWLAGLLDGNNGSLGFFGDDDDYGRGGRWGSGIDNLTEVAGWLLLVVLLLAVAVAIFLVVLWISSRAKFVFLDNVLRGEAHIVEPWKRYGSRGDSLFLWRFLFTVAVIFVLLVLILPAISLTGIASGRGFDGAPVFAVLYLLAVGLVVGIPAAYISLFLDSFIVPIMYRHDLSATQAWKRFWPTLRDHLAYFLLYGIVALVLSIVVVTAMVLIGFFTCCVGFFLFALPYLGTVVTLPVWITLRAFSVEFLEQFGPEYRLFPEPVGGGPVGPAPPSPPSVPPPAPPAPPEPPSSTPPAPQA
jgi:hypothetical protein